MMNKICLLTAVLFLGGCASISFAPVKPGHIANVIATPEQVTVYRTEKPQETYEEIGTIHYPKYGKLETIVKKMQREASNQGGNAIIDLQVNDVGAVGTVIRIQK